MENKPRIIEINQSVLPLEDIVPLLNSKDNTLEKLDLLHLHIEGKTREIILWYLKKRQVPALCSRILRFLAIILAGFGGLCPLLQNMMSFDLNQMGYVSFAMVAVILGFDKFFGFSNTWMRYMLTQISLQKKFADFQLEWIKHRSFVDKDLSKVQAERLFSFLHDFQVNLLIEIEQEIQNWVAEFQINLIQLESMGKETPATGKKNDE